MRRAIEAATALLTSQHGVAHVAQLRACGLTGAAVAGRVRSGSWTYAARDVVAVAGAPATPMRRVWLAFAAVGIRRDGTPRAVAVGGLAAAALHGVVADVPGLVKLVVGRGVWCPQPAARTRVREVRDWPERSFVRLQRLLVTALPDTLVDSRRTSATTTTWRSCSSSASRTRCCSAGSSPGVTADAAGLAPDACDVEVVSGAGRSDCVFHADGRPVVALEFDGDLHRLSRKAFLHDRAKDLALREAGCSTLRFTVEHVDRPERMVADVRRALAAAGLTVAASVSGVAEHCQFAARRGP